MLLTISHDTLYHYDKAATHVAQALRLWPAPSDGQEIKNWHVLVDGKVLRPSAVDGFGNPVATHVIDQPVSAVRLSVRGRVLTHDRSGVHGDPGSALPPFFYLRSTELTALTAPIAELADAVAGDGSDLERLHRLAHAVRDRVDYVIDATDVGTSAGDAFAAGAGVCQDHAQVLIAAARHLGFPARYVSGYLCPLQAGTPAASHAWTEVFVDDLGWVGFDAANRMAPDEHYVRIACGRDYRDAAPVRGVRQGGDDERLEVIVDIRQAAQVAQ